jgi:hypothetical protein
MITNAKYTILSENVSKSKKKVVDVFSRGVVDTVAGFLAPKQ